MGIAVASVPSGISELEVSDHAPAGTGMQSRGLQRQQQAPVGLVGYLVGSLIGLAAWKQRSGSVVNLGARCCNHPLDA